jgi:hypothetical protein
LQFGFRLLASGNLYSRQRCNSAPLSFTLDSPDRCLLRSVMFRILAIAIVWTSIALAGCCPTGVWLNDVCACNVVILSTPPAHSYFEMGTVSSPGGPNTVPADNYRRMQREAACLGATAVILTDQVPSEEPDFWQYPHTGIAIRFATSSLHP